VTKTSRSRRSDREGTAYGEHKAKQVYTLPMDEGRKRVLGIMAAILRVCICKRQTTYSERRKEAHARTN